MSKCCKGMSLIYFIAVKIIIIIGVLKLYTLKVLLKGR